MEQLGLFEEMDNLQNPKYVQLIELLRKMDVLSEVHSSVSVTVLSCTNQDVLSSWVFDRVLLISRYPTYTPAPSFHHTQWICLFLWWHNDTAENAKLFSGTTEVPLYSKPR